MRTYAVNNDNHLGEYRENELVVDLEVSHLSSQRTERLLDMVDCPNTEFFFFPFQLLCLTKIQQE